MRILLYITLVFIVAIPIYSQQLPQYTQYMLNDFVMNPAVAGTKEYYIARSNNRYQWTGITDAPHTYILSIYGPHRKYDMGFGGYVFNDITGPTMRSGLYGSYGYNLRIQNDIRISFGLSIGLLQFKIDGTKITLRDDGDIALTNNMLTNYKPDASFGTMIYASKYYFGIAANQLLASRLRFDEVQLTSLSKLKNHFFITGGYKYAINNDLELEPSLMLKYVAPTPVQFEINAKVMYKKIVWLGTSFRTSDAIALLIGYNYDDQFMVGYSYDFTLTNIRKYSSGSHEFLFGVRFNKIKQSLERPKLP